MFRKLILLSISTVACFSTAVFAVGLGKSELKSGLNQPLKAQIELLSVEDLAKHELKLSLATEEEFERVGVERLFLLNDIRFKTIRNKEGQLIIEMSTHDTIKEPFLNFVVALNYPKGRFVKEYTFLLDPPIFEESASTTIEQAQTKDSRASNSQSSNSEPVRTEEASKKNFSGSSFGPVSSTDTLWGIANQTRPNSQVTIHQTLVAIYRANPDAFAKGNINNLLRGKVLNIPDAETISQVPHRAALQDVVLQNRQWKSGGARSVVSNTQTSSASTEQSSEPRLSLATQDSEDLGVSGGSGNELSQTQDDLIRSQEKSATLQAENDELRARLSDLLEKLDTVQDDSAVNIADAELAALTQSQEGSEDNSASLTDGDTEQQNQMADSSLSDDAGSEPEVASENKTETVSTQAAEEKAVEPKEVERVVPKIITPPQDKGLVDQILGSTTMLASIVGGVVFIALIVFWRMRKRMEEEDFQDDLVASAGAGSMDTTETFELPDVGDDMLDDLDMDETEDEVADSEDESFDPIGEADIYIAYGKFEQAESLLLESIEDNPIRSDLKVKLMECYAENENKDKFDALAEDVLQAVDSEDWQQKINAMREQAWSEASDDQDEFDLPSTEDIFGGDDDGFDSDQDSAESDTTLDSEEGLGSDSSETADGAFSLDDETDTTEESFSLDADNDEDDFSLDSDMESDEEEFNLDIEPEVEPELGDDEEFDLDMDIGLDNELDDDISEASDTPSESEAATETFDALDEDDFSLDDTEESDKLVHDEDETLDEMSFDMDDEDDIDLDSDDSDEMSLDLDEDGFSFDEDDDSDLGEGETGEAEDEISTKLDLARAYIDMGDSDGAKEILNEVLADGSESQKEEAKALIEKAD